jgi:D-xylose transport system substrate-binding protein
MMRKRILAAVAVATLATTALAGCSSSKSGSGNTSSTAGGGGAMTNNKVGILLPDTASSPRWVSADPNELQKECNAYKLQCEVLNANGQDTTQEQQAQQLISWGAGVILETDLDSASGAQIEKEAKAKDVVPIDYDRLTQGGGAAYYVSFDNVQVGKDQGTALTQCPQVAGKSSVGYVEIDGAPTDNNATLFAQGYNSVLSAQPGWKKLDDQTGQWNAGVAASVFAQMLGANKNAINAVMVANDTMAQSVINILKQQGLTGQVAVSGQDATPGGLDNIMAGSQCFSIYKPVAGEADVAIKLASEILSGQHPTAPAQVKDPSDGTEVPSFLATPIVITKANVAKPVQDGYETASAVCGASKAVADLCNANGIAYTYSGS